MKPVILVVEDEVDLNEAYMMILKSQGYEVYSARDGKEALTIADKTSPNLILLDLRMPHLDGIGFLKEYDIVNAHPDTKVIVFSNLDSNDEVDAAYALGATRYILKAWASPNELLRIVKEAVE